MKCKRFAIFILLTLTTLLSACSTYTPPRYSILADNNVQLKQLGIKDIAVGTFIGDPEFNERCRAAGELFPPDGLTYAAYIQRAFADELKMAGIYNADYRVKIYGSLDKLSFSSSQNNMTGYWDISITLTSSTRKMMKVSEHYNFASGFEGGLACKQTAEAFAPAVQELIYNAVSSVEFRELVR
ncbi:MAG: hypothetical protein M0R70_12730 [Nitrospirae bacterium]|nr:hypothetical protein [Nitrospirota bacterium]